MFFGVGTDGDLITEKQVELKATFSNYRNITVKTGSKLIIPPVQTILLVSGVFSIEEGGTVTFAGSIILLRLGFC